MNFIAELLDILAEESSQKLIQENLLLEADWGENMHNFKKLSDEEMPSQGQGSTMLSQWLVCVNCLIYKWYNDGDMYSNQYGGSSVNDISWTANWLYNNIGEHYKSVLDMIKRSSGKEDYQKIIDKIEDVSEKLASDEKFVEKLKSEKTKDNVYKEKGPFEQLEDDDEDEYDDWDDED